MWSAAWTAANERFGSSAESKEKKVEFEAKAAEFKARSKNILSDEVCDDIKLMFWNASWATANERKGYKDDAEKDKRGMEEHYENIIDSNEVQMALADNIKWKGWNGSWHATNKLCGYTDDSRADERREKEHFDKIIQ